MIEAGCRDSAGPGKARKLAPIACACLLLAVLFGPRSARAADLEIGDCRMRWGDLADQIRIDCPRWSLEPPDGERPEQVGLPSWDDPFGATVLELRPPELLAALGPTPGAAPEGVANRGADRHRLRFVAGRLAGADIQLASLPSHPGERVDLSWSDPWSPVVAAVRAARALHSPGLRYDALEGPGGLIHREVWERAPGATLIVLERPDRADSRAPSVTLWERRRSPFAGLASKSAGEALDSIARPLAEWLERRDARRVDTELASELAEALAFIGMDVALGESARRPRRGGGARDTGGGARETGLRVERIELSGTGRWRAPGDLDTSPDILLCVLTISDSTGPVSGALAFDGDAELRSVDVLLEVTPRLLGEALAGVSPGRAGRLDELAVDFWAGSWEESSPRLPGGPLFGVAWRRRPGDGRRRPGDGQPVRWALLRPGPSRAGVLLANGSRPAFSQGVTRIVLAAVPDGFDLELRGDRFDPTAASTYRCHAVRWRGKAEELSCDDARRAGLRWELAEVRPAAGLYRGRLGDEPLVGCLQGRELEIYRPRDGRTKVLFEDFRAHLRWDEVEPGEAPPEPLGGERFWLLDPPPRGESAGNLSEVRGVRRGARAVDRRFELRHVAPRCGPAFEEQRVDRPRLRGASRTEHGVEVERNEHPLTGLASFAITGGIPDESRRRINGSLSERARWLDERFFACVAWDGEVVPRFLSRLWVVAEERGSGSCRFGEPLARRAHLMFDAASGEPIGLASWIRPECFASGPRGELRDRVIEQISETDGDSTCLERAVDSGFAVDDLWLEADGVHFLFAGSLGACPAERIVSFESLRPCITSAARDKFELYAREAERLSAKGSAPKESPARPVGRAGAR